MKFRFTYTHDIEGSFVGSEPGGFDDAQLGFERDMSLWSLVEFYKAEFQAYGTNGVDNGARDWIKNVERIHGPDAIVTVHTEIAPDNYIYETLYKGTLSISAFIERLGDDHTVSMAYNQSSFWVSFLKRFETPVNIQSPLSLDGDSITVLAASNVDLPSQVINYFGSYNMDVSSIYRASNEAEDYIGIIDWENVIIDELDKFALGSQTIKLSDFATPIGIFKAPADGNYRVRFSLVSSELVFTTSQWVATQNTDHSFDVRVQKTNSTSFLVASKTIESVGSNSFLTSSFDQVISMALGEEIAIYASVHSTFFLVRPYYVFGNRRLVWASDVNVATTTVLTLSGEQTIDGFLTSSSRVLVREQVNPAENGIYVTSAGVWARASDSDSPSDLFNQAIKILSGAVYAGVYFRQTETITTLGVSPVNWIEYYETISGLITAPAEKFLPYNGSSFYSFLEITGDTTFAETICPSFLLHDTGAMITDRIVSQNNSFYSEYSGRTNTLARTYAANGCGSRYMLAKGLQIRGYLLTDKPFFISMKDWFEGTDPILPLGIGYEVLNGQNIIRCEDRAYFFDDSSTSTNFSNIQNITRRYDLERQYNSVQTGYESGKPEEISGIDDPQKTTWASRFKNIGKPLVIISKFIAQSLSWEITRRNTVLRSKDYKFDDNIFILAIKDTSGVFSPELNENFTGVTNLLNEATRYNKRLTPARNFIRNLPYIGGALQAYVGSLWRFVSGEGNYDMQTTMNGSCSEAFDGIPVSEKQNFTVTTDFVFKPIIYEIDHYMNFTQYKLIKANRNLAIGVSQSTIGHKKVFIKSLSVNPISGEVQLIVWAKEELDLDTITTPPAHTRIFDFSFDTSFE